MVVGFTLVNYWFYIFFKGVHGLENFLVSIFEFQDVFLIVFWGSLVAEYEFEEKLVFVGFFFGWFGEPCLEFFDACFGYGVDFSCGSVGVVFYLFGYEFVF